MLSLARCRKVLGFDRRVPNDEIKAVRDQLYLIAEVALDALNVSDQVNLGEAANEDETDDEWG